MDNKLKDFLTYVRGQDTKIGQKVLNWLNNDCLAGIIVKGNIYWLETTNSYIRIPQYIRDYIKHYMYKNGYKYLYDVTSTK